MLGNRLRIFDLQLEVAVQCKLKPDYKYSLMFWLDLVVTASLVADIGFLYDGFR